MEHLLEQMSHFLLYDISNDYGVTLLNSTENLKPYSYKVAQPYENLVVANSTIPFACDYI